MNSASKINVMVDIETLDIKSTAVILSIGACTIEDFTEAVTFYEEIDPGSQPTRTQSQATIDWWKTQSGYPDGGIRSLKAVLTSFSRYLSSLRAEPIIWCKGTDFDVQILANAFAEHGMEVPWKYNAVRDFRTVKKLFPVNIGPNATPHNALADALHQSAELRQCSIVHGFMLEGWK